MTYQITEIQCPNCGAKLKLEQEQCDHCQTPFIISTFNSVNSMPMPQINKYVKSYQEALREVPENRELNNSIAMCYLKLKFYDKALIAFEKAVEDDFDNSETFFYAAVCLLKGKKAFLTPRSIIDKIEEYIQAAIAIEPRGIYYYFWAYIRYDHHFRKSYCMTPNYSQLLDKAKHAGLSPTDVRELYNILQVQRPDAL